MKLAELSKKSVVIWGLGREGMAILPYVLNSSPAHITLVDDNEELRNSQELKEVAWSCSQHGIKIVVVDQAGAPPKIPGESVIIKSPGISRYHEYIEQALKKDCVLSSGTDLWLSEHGGQNIIGVTGSKGKSTTAALIEHILNQQGVDVQLGGNIGSPLIEMQLGTNAWAVAEISSFQAADISTSPEIGVLTSLFPEHLDWHDGYEQYVRDKLHLFSSPVNRALFVDGTNGEVMNQTSQFEQRRIVNAADSIAWHNTNSIFYKDTELMAANEFTLHGGHNLNNVVLAVAAADCALDGLDTNNLREALATFRGLPHRLQHIGELNGTLVIDDGLATNPGACVAALNMFSSKKLAIFLGGYDRGLSYDVVAEALVKRTAPLLGYLLGPAGEKIRLAFEQLGGNPLVFLQSIEKLSIGVKAIAQNAQKYDVIILAPGGASFDEFENYEQRSDAFRDEMVTCGMKPIQ